MGLIKLNKMEFYSYHGCFDAETKVGNYFTVDLQVKAETSKPEASDRIEDALNYQYLYNIVANEMAIPSKILENVAKRIMNALFSEFPNQILHVEVTVAKMNPPLGGKMESVSVTLEE